MTLEQPSIRSAGYQALVEQYDLQAFPHYRESWIGTKFEKAVENGREAYLYPKKYLVPTPDSPFSQLEFALKYDGMHLGILKALFQKLGDREVEDFVRSQPTGKFARKIWYLYESLMAKKLNIPDAHRGSYVLLLDPDKYYTGKVRRSRRHYVDDNLLGNFSFCPFIRKTKQLYEFEQKRLNETAQQIVSEYQPEIMGRAMRYLYTKETLSSYEIEHERPTHQRMARFVRLLQESEKKQAVSKEWLIELQNRTVDPRFAESDFRQEQNYIGEEPAPSSLVLHYICPQPQDVSLLMEGWLDSLDRMMESNLNPVLVASAAAFGFVYIHPFLDGNGRLHRFLIHFILSHLGFVPSGGIFPISASILNQLRDYDEVLERVSNPLLSLISEYKLDPSGRLEVNQPTLSLYQYLDYTACAEFLFRCVETTIQSDFQQELDCFVRYDQTKQAIQELVDMPDRDIDLIIQCIRQNHGTLSQRKREKKFKVLTNEEIVAVEELMAEIWEL